MSKALAVVLALVIASPAFAQKKEAQRLQQAGEVVKEVRGMPEGLSQDLLRRAKCVVVLPSVKKFAIGIGGSYGRGAMVCRTGANFTGAWSQPVMVALEGGNWGLQLGGQATDFLLLLMSDKSANGVLSSKVKLGADASAAAGPVGRAAGAHTDASMRAEILTYSRSRGLFAGISLEGSTLRPDGDANEHVYGHKVDAKDLIKSPGPGGARAAAGLIAALSAGKR